NVKIHVSAADSISDQPITISVSGLKPLQRVTLHSHTTIDNGNAFECVAVYKADGEGRINVDKDESIGGSYKGVERMGLLWAMQPSLLNKQPFARFVKLDVTTPLMVRLCVYEESIFTLEQLGLEHVRELASTQINRWFMAEGTKRIPVTVESHGVHGTLFIPPGEGPFPAVLNLFGGYPGTMEFKASLLASRGFVTLALAYYGVAGMPTFETFGGMKSFELEYFEKAFDLLSSIPVVDSSRGFGLICISFSTHIVLAAASVLPQVKCVVWINGMIHTSYITLTYRGKEFPVSTISSEAEDFIRNGIFVGRRFFPFTHDPFHPEVADSLTPFYQRKNVAYLFIAGLDDNSVQSELWANQAEMLLKMADHPRYKILRYPGAGHLIEPPFAPHNAITAQKGQSVIMDWGGEMIPHCRAQKDSWAKQVNFLRENLVGKLTSKM
uniref:BAAT/Acyl-CoA thioester hydrolase C-terminal domain-containing protein n=1 Tax=Ciona savignyi TaxID=51511 RepID=H2Y511_CIOSA